MTFLKQREHSGTSNMQFGFKENMSTGLAASVVLLLVPYSSILIIHSSL